MKKILLTISVCSFDGYYAGSIKVATVEKLVPVIMQSLEEAGIVTKGYETAYLPAEGANPLCQASMLASAILLAHSTMADYVKRRPEVDQSVYLNSKPQN